MVGVIGNAHVVNDRHNVQVVGRSNLRAVAEVAGALPLMFAGTPDITDIDALLGAVDGILLTGARANVHPTCFGVDPDPRHEPYDQDRDAMALALVEACVARGVPLFGICRGFQEMNVAFGGSLHPEIRDIPGRMNHRMPRLENGEIHPDPEVVFADRHEVRLVEEGVFARLLGCQAIRVNSLHGQGILQPGGRVVVEGVAEDGTIEAIRIADAPSFALGVQWHAEYDPQHNPINRALFKAFGAALLNQAARVTCPRGGPAAALDIDQVRIADAPEPHLRLREGDKIASHEGLMEVVAGPDLGVDPVGLGAHEDHDARSIVDIGAARDLLAFAERFVEKRLHLIDRSDVAELHVGNRLDPDGMGRAPYGPRPDHFRGVGGMKRHVDGVGHLDAARRVAGVLVEVFSCPAIQLLVERSAGILQFDRVLLTMVLLPTFVVTGVFVTSG